MLAQLKEVVDDVRRKAGAINASNAEPVLRDSILMARATRLAASEWEKFDPAAMTAPLRTTLAWAALHHFLPSGLVHELSHAVRYLLVFADNQSRQIGARLRIAARAEHADQAFGWRVRCLAKLFESNGRLI